MCCGSFTNIQVTHRHPDSEQAFVDHTKACRTQGLNKQHIARSEFDEFKLDYPLRSMTEQSGTIKSKANALNIVFYSRQNDSRAFLKSSFTYMGCRKFYLQGNM